MRIPDEIELTEEEGREFEHRLANPTTNLGRPPVPVRTAVEMPHWATRAGEGHNFYFPPIRVPIVEPEGVLPLPEDCD